MTQKEFDERITALKMERAAAVKAAEDKIAWILMEKAEIEQKVHTLYAKSAGLEVQHKDLINEIRKAKAEFEEKKAVLIAQPVEKEADDEGPLSSAERRLLYHLLWRARRMSDEELKGMCEEPEAEAEGPEAEAEGTVAEEPEAEHQNGGLE